MHEYYKTPSRYEFILTNLPLASLLTFLAFVLYPLIQIIEFKSGISSSFNLFPTIFEKILYSVLVFLLLLYLFYLNLEIYKKMKKLPFLVLNNNIKIDKSLSPHYALIGRDIILTLKWDNITQINVTQNKIHVYYEKNNKIKSEKINMNWCEQKDVLVKALKALCNTQGIAIVDNAATISSIK
jgi:hypothetical protein